MVPNKGLFLDSKEIDQPQGTWRNAKNLLKDEFKGAFTIDPGSDLTATGYPFTIAKPIGTSVFPDGSYVIYSDGINGGLDRIGIVGVDEVYSDIIVDDILNFSSNFPILSSEIDYNYLSERIVAWTDGENPPRILNIDSLPFTLDGNLALVTSSKIKLLNTFPSFDAPSITSTVVETGGSIPAGAYTFCVAYENNDGTRTTATPPQGMVYVVDDLTSSIETFDGVVPGANTGKSISITFNQVDINYQTLVLIGISNINGVKSAFEIKKISIGGSTFTTVFTGGITTPLDLEEILTEQANYIKSKAMVKIKNTLYQANLETQEDIDFQSAANNIRICYNTTLINAENITAHQRPTFAHGEVYAFYIHFILNNGSVSKAFHIPGRPIYGGESPNPTNASSYASQMGVPTLKNYQIDNTTDKGGHTYASYTNSKWGDTGKRVTSLTSPATSNMGYWENENELYPANFPGLAGTKVRHHVFPTYRQCKTLHYSSETNYLKDKLDILGIDIANVIIPSDIADKVSGYFISYARKTFENSINYGLETYLAGGLNVNDTVGIHSNFANTKNLWNNTTSNERTMQPAQNKIISHNPDLLLNKPQLSTVGLYIDFEMRYRFVSTNAGSNVDSFKRKEGFVLIRDYIKTNYTSLLTTAGVYTTHPSRRIEKISSFEYVPNGVISNTNYDNTKGGECLALNATLTGGNVLSHVQEIKFSTSSSVVEWKPDNSGIVALDETILYSLRQIKSNVFDSFDKQELIQTNELVYKLGGFSSSTRNITGGDRFIGPNTKMILGGTSSDTTKPEERGLGIYKYITESKLNTKLRYIISTNSDTIYYPKSGTSLSFYYKGDDPLLLPYEYGGNSMDMSGYNTTYNSLNEYHQPIIWHPLIFTTNKFPYRVIRSQEAGTNINSLNSWKTYLTNDIYESNRDRGEIINLAKLDDVLLIHHKYGLFRTLGKEKLTFDTTEVYLGSGDIFNQEPKEPIPSKLGYAGTQNIFSCVPFKGGYAWWNQLDGRVFLLTTGGLIEISNIGLYNYFRDNSLIDTTLPFNTIAGNGLLSAYDPKYNRLIFVKKDGGDSFTLSFSLNDNYWVSYHDYTPDYLFQTNKTFFGFKDNKIHKFNSITKKAKYLEGSINSSYIDIVFNQLPQENKLFFNVNWLSEFKNENGEIDLNKTLSSIQFTTNYQDTGEINLIPFTSFGISHNIRSIKSTWNFNKLRDTNADIYKKKFLVGNYAIGRFKFNNSPNLDSSQNSLYLYDFNVKVRKAEL